MGTTPTANYGFSKITPATEKDVWGPIQSTTLDGIDTQIKNRQNEIATKANTSHSHIIADVTGLQTALDGKSAVGHTHVMANITDLAAALALKAPLASPPLTGIPTAPTAAPGTNTTQLATTAFVAAAIPGAVAQKFCAVFKFDAGASAIPVGSQDEMYIPFVGTITGWTILTDVAGTITFDLWGAAYASFPPTVANTITGSAKPLIGSSARKGQSSTLTGWNTALVATQTLIANVDACATIKRATLILEITKA